MLPSIYRQPALESSLKVASSVLKSRTLKQHLFTPNEVQVPQLQQSHLQTIHQPVLIRHRQAAAAEKREEHVLDGFSLLESVGLALPDDAVFAVLSDRRFTGVAEDDLVFFAELLYLDASENFLQLASFSNLPRLQELRLACNDIRDIQYDALADRFTSLQCLDLSYNSLSAASVLSLECLPCLRELNLCGNQLSELPDMDRFCRLERLVLENNKFEGGAVFHSLCGAPNLRDLSLAYNFLCEIPKDTCQLGCFRVLEKLDLAFNYFGSDGAVCGVLDLTRVRSVLLYGNPLLGPTGEDPHFIYIEDLANAALEARGGQHHRNSYPIEIITEIPRKRTYKKGEDLGRRILSYKNFEMTVAKRTEAERIGGKSARDWIEEGNNTLFSQAVALAQAQLEEGQVTDRSEEGPPAVPDFELTFLTRPLEEEEPVERGREEGHDKRKYRVSGKDRGRDEMADRVMSQVAEECGLTSALHPDTGRYSDSRHGASSNELSLLRDRVVLAKTAAVRAEREAEGRERESHPGLPGSRGKQPKNMAVPDFLLRRSMTESLPLATHPIALTTAITALRFAIRHPLTNYSEIPAKSFMSAQDHQSGTTASANRMAITKAHFKTKAQEAHLATGTIAVKESRPVSPSQDGYGTGSSFAYHKMGLSASQRISGSKANRSNTQHHKDRQFSTLQHIDDILDNLNVSSREMASERMSSSSRKISQTMGPGGGGYRDDEMTIKGREGQRRGNNSGTGISNLIHMVDEVVSKLA